MGTALLALVRVQRKSCPVGKHRGRRIESGTLAKVQVRHADVGGMALQQGRFAGGRGRASVDAREGMCANSGGVAVSPAITVTNGPGVCTENGSKSHRDPATTKDAAAGPAPSVTNKTPASRARRTRPSGSMFPTLSGLLPMQRSPSFGAVAAPSRSADSRVPHSLFLYRRRARTRLPPQRQSLLARKLRCMRWCGWCCGDGGYIFPAMAALL